MSILLKCTNMRVLVYEIIKSTVKNPSCSYVNNTRKFYINSIYCKRRKTGEEKKSDRMIEYAPKVKGDVVDVWQGITVAELAKVLNKNVDYIRDIFLHQVTHPNTAIDDIKFLQQGLRRSGRRMKIIGKPQDKEEVFVEKNLFRRPPPKKSDMKPRPPVVTVMGHVDHGKTTLLDALRHSNVVDQEFGGITQHIGAFSVVLNSGARITFLDTPGHAAFTAMRERGANLTDIVVLVVAADDGVMEQTVESIRMAKQAKVPILVAINKIDAPKADIERTENMLMQADVHVERLGGDVQAIPISALKRKNLDLLTEALVLQAELLEIGADPTGPVEAIVVESKVHPYRGKISTIVVQRGTLEKGDILIAGTSIARVRVIKDADGNSLNRVSPGFPAEIDGWKDLPSAGDEVLEVESERRAREVVRIRQELKNIEKQKVDLVAIEEKIEHHQKEYKEKLQMKRRMGRFRLKNEGPRKPEIDWNNDNEQSVNLIVKADVDGTLEAILNVLDTYDDNNNCKVNLVHYGVGAISENDLEIGQIFNAKIYAFNNNCSKHIQEKAESDGVEIKHFNVIYKMIDDIKEEINKKLPLIEIEEELGIANVLQQFEINQKRNKIPVAGCRCVKGILKKTANFKVIRNEQIIYVGPISSMRHIKEEVDTIKTDTECGIQLADKTITFEPGDKIICFRKNSIPQTTQWDPGF